MNAFGPAKVRIMVILLLAVAGGGCGRVAASKEAAAPPVNPLAITPTPEIHRQIEVGQVRTEGVASSLRVAARVEADETRIARVNVPATGRIVRLEAMVGQQVKRGEVLATVYSTELATAQSTFLKSLADRQLAEHGVARAKRLVEAGVIGEAELQRRDAELQCAAADLAASREHLAVLGLPPEETGKLETTRRINSRIQVFSNTDGVVLERKATIGQVVQAAETVFVVADLSTLWVVADVPEQNAAVLHIGDAVEADVPALPDDKITGRLSFVSAVVNSETRTVRVRMDLANANAKFKPSMLATMSITEEVQRRPVVPATAVVRENNTNYVFVQTEPATFVLRRVLLGDEHRGVCVVRDGVRDGDKIVVHGAFHLNNERNRRLLQASEDT